MYSRVWLWPRWDELHESRWTCLAGVAIAMMRTPGDLQCTPLYNTSLAVTVGLTNLLRSTPRECIYARSRWLKFPDLYFRFHIDMLRSLQTSTCT
jgi:hypothetical protein